MQVFLDEKRFEGCLGFQVTDEVRVTIAAYACLLLLHLDRNYYPRLRTVLIYPAAYEARTTLYHGYIQEDGVDVRIGESWPEGRVVLSWMDVKDGIRGRGGGENVVLHEFAHQLDEESGEGNGTPVLPDRAARHAWVEVFEREYQVLVAAVAEKRTTFLDAYGAENPAEFFAIATEHFFGESRQLRRRHADLYAQLKTFYRQDPAALELGQRDTRCRSQPGHYRR